MLKLILKMKVWTKNQLIKGPPARKHRQKAMKSTFLYCCNTWCDQRAYRHLPCDTDETVKYNPEEQIYVFKTC